MTASEFRRCAVAHPFEPFAIHLADGRSVKVTRREGAALTEDEECLLVLNEDRMIESIDLLLVVSLLPLPQVPPPSRR